jgi:hypothetical protein
MLENKKINCRNVCFPAEDIFMFEYGDVKKAVEKLKEKFAHSTFCDEPNNLEDIFNLIDKIFGEFKRTKEVHNERT